jgi:hypothetical protein
MVFGKHDANQELFTSRWQSSVVGSPRARQSCGRSRDPSSRTTGTPSLPTDK